MKRVALCDQFTSDHDEFRGDISTDEKTRRQWPRTRLQTVGYCRILSEFPMDLHRRRKEAGNPVVGCM
jgi:hypothetical protein